MSNYQGRLSTRQLTIFIYFYSHWHFFNIFVTVWQPWAIISLRQNSGHTVILKISYSSTENMKKISKLKICLAGPSDPSETISSDLIKVCCLSMSNFSNVNNSPFRQVERNCELFFRLANFNQLPVLPKVAWSRQSGVFGSPCGVKNLKWREPAKVKKSGVFWWNCWGSQNCGVFGPKCIKMWRLFRI